MQQSWIKANIFPLFVLLSSNMCTLYSIKKAGDEEQAYSWTRYPRINVETIDIN